jgi:Ca2+-binding EF-hand superfamily protein
MCFRFYKAIKTAWDKFDLNGDGEVSTSEVEQFLAQLDIKVAASQKERILNELDRFSFFNQ